LSLKRRQAGQRRRRRGKAILRAAAARTLDALLIAIRDALEACVPDECTNFFAACGYDAN